MATIIKRKGKWQVKIRRTNFKQLSRTFITKDNAIKWARETENKVEKGLFEDLSQANSISLKEILQEYLAQVTMKKKGWRTEKYKINKLCRHDIAKTKLSKLTPLLILKFREEISQDLNPSTVNKYTTLINVSIKYARQILGIYIPNNPCEFIKRLKEPEFQGEVITYEEEERLLKNAKRSKANWIALGIMLGIDCGLRRGEILKLNREDINFLNSTCTLRDTKNGTSRSIGLSQRVMKEINNLPLNINGRLISSSNGDNFKFYWMQLKKWSKVSKTFHSTRHTFASRAAMKGWSIVEIAQQGGWKELRVLKRYTHLKAEYLADKLKSS